jgi:hypothetical protein
LWCWSSNDAPLLRTATIYRLSYEEMVTSATARIV